MCQTYKIAICDDLATDRNYLSSLCEIWGSHNSYHIQISEFTSAETKLWSKPNEVNPQTKKSNDF